jgi:hypothetical protein
LWKQTILTCLQGSLDLWWLTFYSFPSKQFFIGTNIFIFQLEKTSTISFIYNRLHIQGTRTIIDNLDTGASVIPILTRYDGFFDCWNTITREEGRWGLYKGLGALILQYALQFSIIKGSLFTFYHMGDLFKPSSIQPVSPRNQAVLSDRQDRSPNVFPEPLRGYPLHQQFN